MSDATIGIGIDSSGARSGAREVRRSLDEIKGAAGKTTGAFDRMKSSVFNLKNALLGLGAGLVAKTFLDVARETENLEVRLKFLTGSAQLAARAFRDIRDFAATVPFTFQEIQSASANLLVAAKGPEELNKLLRITGDLAATTGLGFQQTAEQIQRAMTAGIASADLFREKGVAALLGFQQGVTTTAEATRKRIFELWDDATFRLVGASEEMASTWDGMVSMMEDKWFAFRSTVMDNGPFQALKAALKEVDSQFIEAGDSVQDFGERLGIALAEALVGITRFGAQAIRDYGGVVEGAWDIAAALWENWKSLANSLGVSPGVGLLGAILFGKVGLAVAGGLAMIQWFKDQLDLMVANVTIALENIPRSLKVFNEPVFGDGTLREFETLETIRARNAEGHAAAGELYRELLESVGLVGAPETAGGGAAESLDNIADAMESVIDALLNGKKASEKLVNATEEVDDTVDEATKTYQRYIAELELGNDVLQLELEGRDLQARQMEEAARLTEKLGRALEVHEIKALNELIATRERLNEQIEAQEEAEREAVRASEEAAREYERIWDRAGDNIQDALGDSFKDVLDGNINSFKDFGSKVLDIAKTTFAQVAAAMVFQGSFGLNVQGLGGGGISVPGIGGGQVGGGGFSLGGLSDIGGLLSGGGLGSLGFNAGAGNFGVNIAQFIGGGAETQALFGNAFARGGSIGGIAGGFAGNFLADSLLGDRGAGASIGGSIGAIAGSFIPIPVLGTAIGAFAGNAIGGLFGNSSVSEGPTLEAVFDNNGRRTGLGVDNDGDMAAARQLANSFGTAIEALLDVSGGTLNGGAYISNSELSGLRLSDNNGQWLAFDDETALLSYLVDNRLTGGDPTITRALQNSQASDVNGLLADAATAQGISDFISAANDNTGQVQQAIDAIWENARDMIAKASELGFSIQDLTAINDVALSNAESVVAQRDLSARSTVLSGVLSASGSIRSFLDAQQLSANSSLNPLARFEAAQDQFGDLLADVRGGDLSKVGALTGAASTLLDIGSSRFASTESFVGLERFVTSSLNSVNQGITSEDFIQDQTDTLIASLDVQTSQLDALNSLVARLDELLAQQRADAAARAA